MRDQKLQKVYPFLMERAMRKMKKVSTHAFKEKGWPVTIDQWVLLKQIGDVPYISQVEVAEFTFKDPASVTRIIDQLVHKELAFRENDANDRRRINLGLTPAGKDLYQTMIPAVQQMRKSFIEGVAEEDLEAFKRVVNRIYENLN